MKTAFLLALLFLSSCCKEEVQPICGEVVFTVWSPTNPQPRYVAVRVPPSTSLTYLDISQEQYDQVSAGDWFCGPLWCCGGQPSSL